MDPRAVVAHTEFLRTLADQVKLRSEMHWESLGTGAADLCISCLRILSNCCSPAATGWLLRAACCHRTTDASDIRSTMTVEANCWLYRPVQGVLFMDKPPRTFDSSRGGPSIPVACTFGSGRMAEEYSSCA